jgi:hypothetical protein
MTMTMVVPLFLKEVKKIELKTGYYEGVGA